MPLINNQIITTYPTNAAADALAAKLIADDADTDYRVMPNENGFYIAIFEDGEQIFTL